MSNTYYTAISRDEFINLYKFGNININTNYIIIKNAYLADEIIKLLNIMPFSQEEDYLILEFQDDIYNIKNSTETIKTNYILNIKKIKNVYTLSKRAQQFYKTKFDQRINFKVIPYENILKEVSRIAELKDMDNGIDILFEQYEITNKKEVESKLTYEIKEDFLTIDDHLESNFKNIYLDFLFYKRENKFPKEDAAYIFDLIIITLLTERKNDVIYKYKQGELKLDTSYTYNKLQDNKKSTLYEYINFIKESDDEKIKIFIKKIDISTIIIGSIFLKIKYLLLNKNETYKEEIRQIIDDFKPLYVEEVSISLYLIGLVFGYKKLYDDYYDFINLDIFNQKDIETKNVLRVDEIEKNKNLDTLPLTDNEVKSLSLVKLKEMAKSIGLAKGLSKFKSNDEDKIRLYKEIKNHKNILNI